MAFILKADLYTSILPDELEEITRGDDDIVNGSIEIAISEVRGYLSDNFDLNIILAKTADARNAMLVSCCVSIAIYEIVARCQAGNDLKDREKRYERAKSWLKMIQKTDLYPDLERLDTTKQGIIAYGSNSKRSNYY